MSARSRILAPVAISCALVLLGLALAGERPSSGPPARSESRGDRVSRAEDPSSGRPELEFAHGLARAEAAAPRRGERPRGTFLDLRNRTIGVGEIELVLTRGGIEWGRGLARGDVLRFEELEPGAYLLRSLVGGGWLPDIPPGEEWRDGPDVWRRVLVPREGATLELRFVRPARIAGILSDPRGAPLADARVLVQDLLRPAQTWVLSTDEDGSFVAGELYPSRYGITLAEPALREFVAVPREETLRAGQAAWIDLRLEAGRRSLRGRVLDGGRTGVEGLQLVCVLPEEAVGRGGAVRPAASRVVARGRTGADGGFRLERLPDVPLQLAVEAGELDLRADGRPRRLLRAFDPVQVGAGAGETDVGVLAVERYGDDREPGGTRR